jgi:hypothetical protein
MINIFHQISPHYMYMSERKSPAGWRSAPTLNPKMRRGLSVLLVMRDGGMNTRRRKGLEWFGPPERNTLLHCVLDCCGSFWVRVNLCCNVACLPFYSWRGVCTKVLSPNMWAQGQNVYSTWDYKCLLLGQSSRALTPEISVSSACWGSFLHKGRWVSASHGTGALFTNRLDRCAVCGMTLTPSASGVDRTH